MSQYIVSARKYRPARFEDVVGQEHVSKTLKNALQTDHLAHAFLFCGPRGVGKTTCARILAKVINCEQAGADAEPCNTCSSCRAFNENASFNIVELDAASNNSVDAMRSLIDQVRFQPQQGRYKVFIIDEVHMLSSQAFNAFLKTLEEPPPYAIFILATTEKHKIIPTILSRCQIYDFKRITVRDTEKHLAKICADEGIQADEAALHIIAQKADGALRDALSIFDRMVAAGGHAVRYEDVLDNLNVLDYDYYFRLIDHLLAEDLPGVLLLFDDVLRKGFDPEIFMLGLAEHIRNLLVCKDEAMLQLLDYSGTVRDRYRAQAALAPSMLLLSALNLANECELNYKMARNKRLHTEMALIKMTYIQRAVRQSPAIASAADPEKKNPDANIVHPEPAAPNPVQAPQAQAVKLEPLPAEKVETPMMPDKAEAPVSTTKPEPGIRKAGKHQVAKISDLSALVDEQLQKQSSDAEKMGNPLNKEHLDIAAAAFMKTLSSEMIRSFLTDLSFDIVDGHHLTLVVPSALAESTVREVAADLVAYLRDYFKRRDLALSIRVEKREDAEGETATRSGPVTDKEKVLHMQQSNEQLKVLWERLGLSLETDA
jgi:DNA polymerase III subunit gamma/tau